MTDKNLRWLRPLAPHLLATTLATLLAACGGGGEYIEPPAAVALAADDTASVDWNTASTLAVTANDTIKNGTAAVTLKTAPSHGTATVVGTDLRYTPAPGYFGSDTLRYSLTVGDRTVDAGVQLTVQAVLKLSGTVRDAPLPGATVTATVAGAALPPVTADASGNYAVTLRVADPTAFITLTAQGAGTQAGVVLSSLVGDASAAAAVAASSASGAVSADALPTANVTHVSTAIAVLSQQSLGKPVASAADLKAAQGLFTASQAIEMATVIKLVADSGIALPSGSANTLALVSNPDAFKNFAVAQSTANADAYNTALQGVLGDASLAAPAQTPTAANPTATTLLLVQGEGASANPATRLTLQAGGVAKVESDQVRSAKWTSSGSEIAVTYDTPAVSTGYSDDLDPMGFQNTVQSTETGFVVRQLGGGTAGGPASVKATSTTKYLDGARAGKVVVDANDWDAQTLVGTVQAFTAADVTAGTRWAGVLSPDFSPTDATYVNQDVLKLVDASTVSFERSGRSGTYRLVDGKLEVTVDGAVFTFTRLFTGPRGEERWLVVKTVNAVVQWVFEPAVFKAQAGAAFTVGGLTQRWESYINVGVTAGKFLIDLHADGNALGISVDVNGKESVAQSGTWALTDGAMVFNRYQNCTAGSSGCLPYSVRSWALLGTVGKRIYVMERLKFSNSSYDQYRVNVYTGP